MMWHITNTYSSKEEENSSMTSADYELMLEGQSQILNYFGLAHNFCSCDLNALLIHLRAIVLTHSHAQTHTRTHTHIRTYNSSIHNIQQRNYQYWFWRQKKDNLFTEDHQQVTHYASHQKKVKKAIEMIPGDNKKEHSGTYYLQAGTESYQWKTPIS